MFLPCGRLPEGKSYVFFCRGNLRKEMIWKDILTGWWLPFFIFPYDLGISSSQLTKSYFSEGWQKTTNQLMTSPIWHPPWGHPLKRFFWLKWKRAMNMSEQSHIDDCRWFFHVIIFDPNVCWESQLLTMSIDVFTMIVIRKKDRKSDSSLFSSGFTISDDEWLLDMVLPLRPNTSSCPRFSAVIFVCAENEVNMGVFFASWLTSCHAQHRDLCESLTHHHHHHHHHHHQP